MVGLAAPEVKHPQPKPAESAPIKLPQAEIVEQQEQVFDPDKISSTESQPIQTAAAETSPIISRDILKAIAKGDSMGLETRAQGYIDSNSPSDRAMGLDLMKGAISIKIEALRKGKYDQKTAIKIAALETKLKETQIERQKLSSENPDLKDNIFANIAKDLGLKDAVNPVEALHALFSKALTDKKARSDLFQVLESNEELSGFAKTVQEFYNKTDKQRSMKKGSIMVGGAMAVLMLLTTMKALKADSGKQ